MRLELVKTGSFDSLRGLIQKAASVCGHVTLVHCYPEDRPLDPPANMRCRWARGYFCEKWMQPGYAKPLYTGLGSLAKILLYTALILVLDYESRIMECFEGDHYFIVSSSRDILSSTRALRWWLNQDSWELYCNEGAEALKKFTCAAKRKSKIVHIYFVLSGCCWASYSSVACE